MTRSPLRLTAAALACALLASCDTSSPTELGGDTNDISSVVREMGFRPDMVKDFGSYYLVEGDITISRTAVQPRATRARVAPGPRFQFTTLDGMWNDLADIRVDLGPLAANPEWQAAMRDAIAAWSAIPGTVIHLVEGGPADITVTSECRFDGVLGRAEFPANGNPGPSVVVNNCWVVNGILVTPTPGARTHTAAHELGHTLGFRHTNLFTTGESIGTPFWVTGTPENEGDAASVMNGLSAGTEWVGFSFWDRFATVVKYPLEPAVTVTNSGGSPLVSWGAIAGVVTYDADLVEHVTIIDRNRNITEDEWIDPVLNVTTSTSVLDTNHPWTGHSVCTTFQDGARITRTSRYRVRANFPAGATETLVAANVGPC